MYITWKPDKQEEEEKPYVHLLQFVVGQDGNDVYNTNIIHYAHKLYHAGPTFWFMTKESQILIFVCNLNILDVLNAEWQASY